MSTRTENQLYYVGMGAMTGEVASILTGRDIHSTSVLVPGYEARFLRSEDMGEAEREIMGGAPRWIAMHRPEMVIAMQADLLKVTEEDLGALRFFDDSDPAGGYEEVTVNVPTESGAVSALLIARRRVQDLIGTAAFDSRKYPRYMAFSFDPVEARQKALAEAAEVRKIYLAQ